MSRRRSRPHRPRRQSLTISRVGKRTSRPSKPSDRTAPPPKNALLFVGSSTIVRWKTLQQDYPASPIINRGFGGNQIADSTHFADRMIFPYQPRMIFLRAGGNDIHSGKTPEQVFADFKAFVATVHAKLPKTEIVYISLSPSIARWDERDAGKKLNTLIADFVNRTPRLQYIETADLVLDATGAPRPELFVEDKLHFSPEGYKLLIERVRPYSAQVMRRRDFWKWFQNPRGPAKAGCHLRF